MRYFLICLVTLPPCHLVTLSSARGEDRPRVDRLGDPLPAGALLRLGSIRLRHEIHINCLAFSPDGKTLASGHSANTITLWDPATGKEIRRLRPSSYSIYSLQYSSDGHTLAVGGGDGAVRLLDPTTGMERRALQDPARRYGDTFAIISPDGRHVVSFTRYSRNVLLWDATTGTIKQRYSGFDTYQVPPLAFTPDGKHFVALWTDNKLHLLESETGKDVRALEGSAPAPGTPAYNRIQAVAFAPGGKRLAFSGGPARFVSLLDVDTGKLVTSLSTTSPGSAATSMAITPDGRFLIDSGGNAVRVWGLASGKVLRHLTAPSTYYNAGMAVGPDGKAVATASGNAIRLWNVAAGREVHPAVGHQGPVVRLAFSGDGKRLASAGTNTLRLWDTANGREVALLRPGYMGGYTSLIVSADGKTVRWLGGDRVSYRWRPGLDGEAQRQTPARPVPRFTVAVVAPDGKTVAGIGDDKKVRLVDLTADRPEKVLTTVANPHSTSLTFSPDGRRLALCTQDRQVIVYDVATAAQLHRLLPEAGPRSYYGTPRVEFSPDGRTLLKFDSDLRGYEMVSGRERFRLPFETTALQYLCWSADGRVVARGNNDGTAVVYDVFTSKPLLRADGKQGSLYGLALSRDGRLLATGGGNTTVLVWSVSVPRAERPERPDVEALWRDLGGEAGMAFRAVNTLAVLPDEAVKLFGARLKPPAEADPKHIARLITDLDSDEFRVREKAYDDLAALGVAAEGALRKAVRSGSLEVRRRAEELLSKLSRDGVAPERLRFLRGVEVLERLDTPAARAVLRGLAKMKLEAVLAQDVQATLARLGEPTTGK
jgi:WD40 repeat protein